MGGASRIFEGVWGCTLTSTPHIQPLQGKRRAVARRNARDARYARDAAVAEEDCKAVRKGRQAGWARWGGRHVGVAGRVGTLAWSDGRQGGWWEEKCIFM